MEELATGYGLIEGPVWDPARQCLYYSDVPNGGVFRLDADGSVSEQFPHRRGIGGMALHEADGLVVGGRNLAFKSFAGGPSRVLLDNDVTEHAIGFNDFTTDAQGRLWAGSLAFRVFGGEEPRPGHLHRVDLDGSAHTLSDGVMLTNGMGFSPDGTRLYHSDARAELIRVYDVDEAGGVSPWRGFSRIPGDLPDGVAGGGGGTGWGGAAPGGRGRPTARCGWRSHMAGGSPFSRRRARRSTPSRCRCRWLPACASAAPTCATSTSSPALAAARTRIAAPSSAPGSRRPACRWPTAV